MVRSGIPNSLTRPGIWGYGPVAIAFVLVFAIWSLLYVVSARDLQRTIDDINNANANLARAFDEHTLRSLDHASQITLQIEKQYEKFGNRFDLSALFKEMQLSTALVSFAVIVDEEGYTVLGSDAKFPRTYLGDREHIRVHRENDSGKPFISKPVRTRVSGEWAFLVTRRINHADGSYGGVVSLALNPAYFVDFYKQVRLGEAAVVALVGTDGVIRARMSDDDIGTGQDISASNLFLEIKKASSGHFMAHSKVDGRRRLFSYRAMTKYPMVLVVGVAEDVALHEYNKRRAIYERSAAAATVIILLVSLFISQLLRGRQVALHNLRASEERYRNIFETANEGIWVTDENAKTLLVNARMASMIGRDAQAMQGTSLYDYMDESARAIVRQQFVQVINGQACELEGSFSKPEGGLAWGLFSVSPFSYSERGSPGALLMITDITERKVAEARTQAALREKEVLLKEIYHRVKNNLQVVSSLLSMQGGKAGAESRGLLEESANRVKSMALVHEQLYRSQNLSSIVWKDYAEQLVQHLRQANGEVSKRVATRLEVEDIKLGIETAIPLGLIVNELISNAYKHAYPGDRGGEIVLRLRGLEGGGVELEVRDDGVGLPPGFDASKVSTLGMQLVVSLWQQLEGRLATRTERGASFTLCFVPDEYEARRLATTDLGL